MRTHQLSWSATQGWRAPGANYADADLVLYFGLRSALADGARTQELRAMFANAHVVGCSTGGQIRNDDVDDEIAAVALRFERTRIALACEAVPTPSHSRACGEAIGRRLAADDLAGIFVLSDGLNVNGSELVAGVTGVIGPKIPLTGGLAGDGAKFEETWSAPIVRRRAVRSPRSGSTAHRSGSATAAPAAGTSSARAAASPARPATCCTNWTAGRRSICTSAISARRMPAACRAPPCSSHCSFAIRCNPTKTWCAPCWRSTARPAR
jgi:hypothetical protein